MFQKLQDLKSETMPEKVKALIVQKVTLDIATRDALYVLVEYMDYNLLVLTTHVSLQALLECSTDDEDDDDEDADDIP